MYSQSVHAAERRSGSARRTGSARRQKSGRREQRRLMQLMVCLLLFFTVFIGKGVFPQKVREVSGQLLEVMERNTDFRGAFARLGQSLAQQESVLGELGEFCVAVFGPSPAPAVPVAAQTGQRLKEEREFLNGGPDQAALTAHYFNLEQVPPEWLAATEPAEPEPAEIPEESAQKSKPEAVAAVGTVLQAVNYDGPALPTGVTMDQLSLGELETVTPVQGKLWSGYGYRDHPIDGDYKFHNGVDLGADEGKEIAAFAAGTVEYVGQSEIYGNYLQLDHGQGVKSFYAHCSMLTVQQGQQVAAGETVARVGSTGNVTGPHLHFEVKCAGVHVDPAYYIQYKTP